MYTDKDLEHARDIAREQYTDGVPASNAQWGEGDPDEVVYTAPDGTTVTQHELDTINQRAAKYCVRNNINIFH